MEERFAKVIKRVFNYFIRGLLFVAPIGLTILILYSAFDTVDSFARIHFDWGEKKRIFIPGLGFLIVTVGTVAIGFVFTTLFPQTFQNWLENQIKNLPLVRIFYSAFKDLISAFVGEKKKFQFPVLITLNVQSNIKKVGFLTRDDLEILEQKEMVAVYCPHSYAFSGEMFIVPTSQVEILKISSAEAMKLIISGGVSMNEE